jgi:hypothetical protein
MLTYQPFLFEESQLKIASSLSSSDSYYSESQVLYYEITAKGFSLIGEYALETRELGTLCRKRVIDEKQNLCLKNSVRIRIDGLRYELVLLHS